MVCGVWPAWRLICFFLGPEDKEEQRRWVGLRGSITLVPLRASPAHLELAANSRAVLDLPHPLSKTLEEGAPAVLQLVANVGNDVARGEVASAG